MFLGARIFSSFAVFSSGKEKELCADSSTLLRHVQLLLFVLPVCRIVIVALVGEFAEFLAGFLFGGVHSSLTSLWRGTGSLSFPRTLALYGNTGLLTMTMTLISGAWCCNS